MFDEGLSWAIKRSFARYVSGLPDGRLHLSDGARAGRGDQLFFPPRGDGLGVNHLVFDGLVLFTGHMGLLAVPIERPRLQLATAEHSGQILTEHGGEQRPFATFDWRVEHASNGQALIGTQVRLTADATVLFAGIYPENEALEDFTVFTRLAMDG